MYDKYYLLTAKTRIADPPQHILIGRKPQYEKWLVEIGKRAYCITYNTFQAPVPKNEKGFYRLVNYLLKQYSSVNIRHLGKKKAQKIWDAQNRKLCRAQKTSRKLDDLVNDLLNPI